LRRNPTNRWVNFKSTHESMGAPKIYTYVSILKFPKFPPKIFRSTEELKIEVSTPFARIAPSMIAV
jgi:hypothetical protein